MSNALNSAVWNVVQRGNYTLGSGSWMLILILSLLTSMVLGLCLIWISIDRNDTVYRIHNLEQSLSAAKEHVVKMEVERDSLLSPYILDKQAEKYGLAAADPGQIRRLTIPKNKDLAARAKPKGK